jgi:hypothetical protein
MRQKKIKIDMTVSELARITNTAFTEMETRFSAEFRDIRNQMATKTDLRETEERLLFAIDKTLVRKSDFDALKNDVADLSGRVTFLEKRP